MSMLFSFACLRWSCLGISLWRYGRKETRKPELWKRSEAELASVQGSKAREYSAVT